MTLLDPSPPRGTESTWMDERRGRDLSRRTSESRGDRERVNGYFSPDRRGDGMEEDMKRTFRYYERGHPLPSNYVPEPKACVPYRNVNLGLPSQRRNTETFIQATWRSESPQRYTYHSNFRRDGDSQRNSPTCHSSVSPDRYKMTESPVGPQRGSSLCRSQARSHSSSHGSLPLPSQGPSRHTSGRSSPSRRRGSAASRTTSPTRTTSSHRRTDSSLLQSGGYEEQQGCSRESRCPSRASNKHSLDSEKLYRNLESISRRGSSAVRQNSYEGSRTSPRTRTDASSLANTQTHNSHEVSFSRNGYSPCSHTSQREPDSRDSRLSRSQGSWQGSSHSLLSLPQSHGSSASRRAADSQGLGGSSSPVGVTDTDKVDEGGDKVSTERSRSSVRRGMEALISEPKKAPVETEEVGMTIDDYIMLADIPKIQVESEEEFPGLRRRNESPSPCREQRSRTYRNHNDTDVYSSRLESDERRRGRERGRDRREKCRDPDNGRSSRRHSAASFHAQSSDDQSGKHKPLKVKERAHPDLPHTQGWMSRLDEQGKWRKHWFVLGDSSLRFYRDSEAEESDDLDGEIDLTSCVNVSDCDIDKNYGLQIQTRSAVFTLSAITSRIRRNWVKLLKQAIQTNRLQSDSSSEKENPRSRRPSSSQPPARFTCRDSASSANFNQEDHRRRRRRRSQTVEGDLSPASQREEGEGWDREQAKRLEERNKWFEAGVPLSEMGSRWDSMELKKGSVPVPTVEAADSEVSRKWAEFETLSCRDMSAQSLTGPQAFQSSTPQGSESPVGSQTFHQSVEEADQSALQTCLSNSNEAPSLVNGAQLPQTNTAEALQKEVETNKQERAAMEVEVDSPCGPRAPCRAKMEAMVVAHRKALQELQEKHAREKKELEEETHRLLQERSQAAAKDMEALKAAHREELDREVEKARRLSGGAALMDSSCRGHVPQSGILHGELNVMSERFSQKCLELNQTEQSGKSRDTELDRKQRELEQLQRENQELKNKLAEEISRMRYFITGQRSDVGSICKTADAESDFEMQLRAKENEVQYLKTEISCLQNEVQSLTKEKEAAYELYKEAYVELSDTRGRSQLELSSLNEHLRLANAALQEGAGQT
ncbi:myosin phosphatase Rho-interacting protein isoform X2 [Kryptolebias marmoratus]|uniref:myosin phosphatase Rho-interacting protein isoform X2 n=1 Tax=Kryptolebias marmoratus TaxID=37003 RepID=UPI000D52FD1F|nr:myosin phosphatase Rho-interacting protein isoform X2 [Kryptolebias marmoratus]